MTGVDTGLTESEIMAGFLSAATAGFNEGDAPFESPRSDNVAGLVAAAERIAVRQPDALELRDGIEFANRALGRTAVEA